MKSTSKVSVQKVGGDTFRVNAKSGRSPMTGRYITGAAAARRRPRPPAPEPPKQ